MSSTEAEMKIDPLLFAFNQVRVNINLHQFFSFTPKSEKINICICWPIALHVVLSKQKQTDKLHITSTSANYNRTMSGRTESLNNSW